MSGAGPASAAARSAALHASPGDASAVPCAHCGLPVPPALRPRSVPAAAGESPGAPLPFCCAGCRQVYGLLHELGLQEYYRLRTLQGAVGQPARPTDRTFADFDDPGFAERYVRDSGRGTRRVELFLDGVHCAACVWLVERLPADLPGVVAARLDLPRARVELEWDARTLPLSAAARALDRLGYTPHPWRAEDLAALRHQADRSLLLRLGVAAACAMNVMLPGIALYGGEASGIEPRFFALFRWAALLLTLPAVLYSARPFFAGAWHGLRRRVPHIDLPISLAILAGFLLSAGNTVRGAGPVYFDSITALVALLLAGRFVQQRAQRRALDTAERLHRGELLDFARRLRADGTTEELPLEALRRDELVEVRSGETIPADGVVVEGCSQLDTAVFTGESRPVPVEPGELVHAHAVNLGARLVVRVRATGAETRVGGLLALVEEAQRRRAPLVTLTDRLGRWFVGGVLGLAAAAAVYWGVTAPDLALERVIALLVVSCPCALGLATPVAMTAALTRAARRGIFVKGADVVETLAKVGTLFLDKTGTLTEGRVELVAWEGPDEALRLAAALEAQSAHPAARALVHGAAARLGAASLLPVSEVLEEAGRGIAGTVAGRAVAVGSLAYLRRRAVVDDPAWVARAEAWAASGRSPVCVALEGRLVGLAALGDTLRPEATQVIGALRRLGWAVGILSGDHPGAVAATAAACGVDPGAARGGLSPEDKHRLVQEAVAAARPAGRAVMMVGDGVNDAAALAAADVGVGVAGGSGAAVQVADVVLTRPGLAPLLELQQGARRVLGIVWRNLGFSLLYNLVGVGLALAGLVSPLVAALLMPLSSLTVIGASVFSRSFAAVGPGRGARWS